MTGALRVHSGTCTTALEAAVHETKMEAMDIDVIEKAKVIVAIALTEVGIIILFLVLPMWPSEANDDDNLNMSH